MHCSGGIVVLTTDKFARSVELVGDDNGDAFGWEFEDNCFDLLPGELKKVKVLGKHRKGTIRAKAAYSSRAVDVEYITV